MGAGHMHVRPHGGILAQLRTTLSAAMVLVLTGCASPIDRSFFSHAFPPAWVIEENGRGAMAGASATPQPNPHMRMVAVQSCEAAEPTCTESCSTSKLRSRFFLTFAEPGSLVSERTRPDGYLELRESGNVYGPSHWLAAAVLCGAGGVVHVGALSDHSRDDAVQLVDEVLRTVRLSMPRRGVQ